MAITDKHRLVRIVEDPEVAAAEGRDEPYVAFAFRVDGGPNGSYVVNVPVGRDAWLTAEEHKALEEFPLPAGYTLDKITATAEKEARKAVEAAEAAALPTAHPNVVATEDAASRAEPEPEPAPVEEGEG